MSKAHPSSRLEASAVNQYTPERIDDRVDPSIFDELDEFSHRGHTVTVEDLVSSMTSHLLTHGVMLEDDPDPTTISESRAVEIVLSGLSHRFPAWFGDSTALESLDDRHSSHRLELRALENAYFDERGVVDEVDVDSGDLDERYRIVVPLIALVLDELQDQIEADRKAAIDEARTHLQEVALEEWVTTDASWDELEEAFQAAREYAESRR